MGFGVLRTGLVRHRHGLVAFGFARTAGFAQEAGGHLARLERRLAAAVDRLVQVSQALGIAASDEEPAERQVAFVMLRRECDGLPAATLRLLFRREPLVRLS